MPFNGVVRNPVYLQVADQLRDAILKGDFAPGEALPTERDLSEQFGVSRQTVREALRALQAQGILSGSGRTAPSRTTVSEQPISGAMRDSLTTLLRLQRVSLRDLVELRCALEGSAVRIAATRPEAEALQDAGRALDEMLRPDITVEEFDEADLRFHVSLVAASGNDAMHLVMLAVRDAATEHLLESLQRLRRRRPALRSLASDHSEILDAVVSGDGEQAAKLLEDHLYGFYEPFLDGPAVQR